MDDIYRRLGQVFHDVFDDDTIELRPGLTAAEIPEWDSLAHIRLILAVQKEFKTKFSAAQIASLKNVGELAALIQTRTAA